MELLLRTYKAAEPASLTLLLISSLVDAARFITEHEELFAAKTARVAIMGGVVESSLQEQVAYLEPDRSAGTSLFCLDSTEIVYRRCQERGIGLVVLSRVAAIAASLPAFIYDELASLGHPVAMRMRESERTAKEGLYRKAISQGADRQGLPARCDRQWFSETFCAHADLSSVGPDQSVWPHIITSVVYDALALLSAHPTTLDAFFEVGVKEVGGVKHCVVGLNKDHSGIRDANKLRSFLMDALRYALTNSLEEARRHSGRNGARGGAKATATEFVTRLNRRRHSS
jgi:hypothetical protein